jgi:pimeloyl-ACP methyl ester carboxylesterase
VALGPKAFGALIGPGFLDHFAGATADDLLTNIGAIRQFLRDCAREPLPPDRYEMAPCWNMVVSASVRAALGSREMNSDDVLTSLFVPVLVTQGREDTVVLPAMAEHILAACPSAKVSWYEGVGHAPPIEDAQRFNRKLADLVQQVQG